MNTETINLVKEYLSGCKLRGLGKDTLLKRKSVIFNLFLFLEKEAGQVTEKDLNNYLDFISEGFCNHTYNMNAGILKLFFDYLDAENRILLNPCVSLERKEEDKSNHLGVFTEDEVRRIIKEIPLHHKLGLRDKAIIEVLYSTGMRLGELVNLNVVDIDFKTGEVFIYSTKVNRERVLPLGIAALNALEEYIKIRHKFMNDKTDREALFVSLKKGRIVPEVVSGAIRKYKRKAGVETKGSAHALRHSMATHMLQRGADIKYVSKMLGHAQIKTSQIYTHILDEDLKIKFRETHPGAKETVKC